MVQAVAPECADWRQARRGVTHRAICVGVAAVLAVEAAGCASSGARLAAGAAATSRAASKTITGAAIGCPRSTGARAGAFRSARAPGRRPTPSGLAGACGARVLVRRARTAAAGESQRHSDPKQGGLQEHGTSRAAIPGPNRESRGSSPSEHARRRRLRILWRRSPSPRLIRPTRPAPPPNRVLRSGRVHGQMWRHMRTAARDWTLAAPSTRLVHPSTWAPPHHAGPAPTGTGNSRTRRRRDWRDSCEYCERPQTHASYPAVPHRPYLHRSTPRCAAATSEASIPRVRPASLLRDVSHMR